MTWILTAISLVGNYLNCRKIREGFILWIICNTGWMMFDIVNGLYSRALLDVVQTIFCIYGLIMWSKKETNFEREGDENEECVHKGVV